MYIISPMQSLSNIQQGFVKVFEVFRPEHALSSRKNDEKTEEMR